MRSVERTEAEDHIGRRGRASGPQVPASLAGQRGAAPIPTLGRVCHGDVVAEEQRATVGRVAGEDIAHRAAAGLDADLGHVEHDLIDEEPALGAGAEVDQAIDNDAGPHDGRLLRALVLGPAEVTGREPEHECTGRQQPPSQKARAQKARVLLCQWAVARGHES